LAGVGIKFTVTATDQFNNTDSNYAGTVTFSTSDTAAVTRLPANSLLSAGVGVFSATLATVGAQTISAADSAASSISGSTDTINVGQAAAGHFVISAPASSTAGGSFTFTVTAEDVFNNVATGYAGTVVFSSSDTNPSTTLPTSSTLASGIGVFSATLTAAGSQSLTVTDKATNTVTGARTFQFAQAPGSPHAVGINPFGIAAGDFAGNGILDLAAANYNSFPGDISTLLGNGDGTFGPATLYQLVNQPLTQQPEQFVVADFNGDGKPDLAVSDYDGNAVSVLLGNGNGTFQTPLNTAPDSVIRPNGITAADFNHDGKLDLAVAVGGSGAVGILLGNGNGTFQSALSAAVGTGQFGIAVADFNHDGNADLAVANYIAVNGGNTLSVLMGNGNGTFGPPVSYALGAQGLQVKVADFNGDGQPDLAVTSGLGSSVKVLMGNGNGSFQAAASYPVPGSPLGLAVGDVDGNGTADLVIANKSSGVAILFGNGNGTFRAAQTIGISASSSYDVVLGDFNADGAPDLAVSALNSNSVAVLLSQNILLSASASILVSPAPATHFGVSATTSLAAGSGFGVTVSAFDQFNNTATGFTGNVTLTSTDAGASTKLPAASPLTSGVGIFSATLTTAGNQTITGTNGSVTGTSNTIQVSAAAASHFAITAQSTTVAGSNMLFTVVAEDRFNNTAAGYTGAVSFSTTDTGVSTLVPGPSPLVAGVGVFSVTLTTAGSQTLTATDNNTSGVTGTITATSGPISVAAGPATHLVLGGVPASITAGAAFGFTVTAEDQFNNAATSFNSTVQFSSSDSQAVLPPSSTLTSGVGAFSATLKSAGSQTLTALVPGNSNVIVNGDFEAGNVGFSSQYVYQQFTNGAYDVVTDPHIKYVNFVSMHDHTSGAGLLFMADGALQSNVVVWSETLPVLPNNSYAFSMWVASISPGSPANLNFLFSGVSIGTFTAPLPAGTWAQFTAPWNSGSNTSLTLSIIDLNTAFSFNDFAFDDMVLQGPNPLSPVSSAAAAVSVSPAVANHFMVNSPAITSAGNPFGFTATAQDAFNNTATGYTGTVSFSSSDNGASTKLPAPSPLSAGVGTFSATLTSAGSQTLTATDNNSSGVTGTITGTSGPITVLGPPTIPPFVQSINRTNPLVQYTDATSVTFTVTFNEAVLGVDPTDFKVASTSTVGTTLVQVTPVSPSVYSVSVSGITGAGTLGLNLVDNSSIHNAAGQLLVQPGAPVAFLAATSYATGSGASPVIAADVNGDGKPDLVASNGYASTVSVLLGNGSGTFQAQTAYPTATYPFSMTVGDINADGKPDLLVGNFGSSTVGIYLGNGDGTFQGASIIGTGNHPLGTKIGDVNGDGKPDLITANAYASTVTVFLGNGNGTFQGQLILPTGAFPAGLTVADVNNDGKLDLLTPNRNSGNVSVLLGNGNGTFQGHVDFAAGNKPQSVAAKDLNGDGIPDLAVTNWYGNTVSVLLGNGNGTFQGQVTFPTGAAPFWVEALDMNGDGKRDLVIANRSSGNVSVLLGNGNGTFQAQSTFAVGTTTVSLSLADLNGDGRPDIVTGNSGTGNVSVLLNAGNGNFTGQVYTIVTPYVQSINRTNPVGPSTNASTVSFTVTFSEPMTGVDPTDFKLATTGTVGATLVQVTPPGPSAVYTVTVSGITGAGTLGLNLVDDGSIRDDEGEGLVRPNGPASFLSQKTFATGSFPLGLATADFNGDGKADLAVANGSNSNLGLLLGNGNGTFQNQATFATGIGPQSVAVGDFNRDGKPDAVTANSSSNDVSVLMGNGDGTFQPSQQLAVGFRPVAVAVADVNGDGNPDILVGNNSSSSVGVLLGNGDGTFQHQRTFATLGLAGAVAAADFNGDGKPDLVVTKYNANPYSGVAVLLGNGDGTFQGATPYPTGGPAEHVAVADFNGDGKVDLVVNRYDNNQIVAVLLGNGNGTFQAAFFFHAGPGPEGVAAVDINGDGKPDLVIANALGSGSISTLLGNGNATFQPPATLAAGSRTYSLVSADFNGDGKPDLATGNLNNTVSIFLNSANGYFTGQVYTIDPTALNVAPYLVSINRGTPAGPNTNATSVAYTVTFSEPVTGVDPSDFQVALTGTAAGAVTKVVPVSGSVYTLTVSGVSGNGTLGLNLVDNGSIKDADGNGLVKVGSAASFLNQTTFGTGHSPVSTFAADLNGDGKFDLVAANLNSATVSVLLGDGTGALLTQTTFPTGSGPRSVVVADVNGDGNPDIVVANTTNPASISVLLGNGNGTFQGQMTVATGSSPTSVAVADVNGDGKADIVVANSNSNTISVLLGRGDGSFEPQEVLPTGLVPTSLAIADINGDGRADIVVANSNQNSVGVLLGNGDGTFQNQSTFVATGPYGIAVADFNGDGKPDIVTANNNAATQSVSVLIGNGDGSFQAQRTFGTGYGPFSVSVADVNGDGKLDLVVANRSSYTLSVLLGNGNGTFQSQTTYTTGSQPSSVAVGDVNGDGRMDLFVANTGTDGSLPGSIGVLLNTSNGNFTGQLYTIDNTSPFVQSINRTNPAGPTANAGSVVYTVTFSEPVTGVDPTDFALALGGTVTAPTPVVVSGGGAVYTVTVNGISGLGTLGLNLVDNGSIHDLAGNLLGQAGGPVTFQNQLVLPTGPGASRAFAADVNSDGKPDLVVTNDNATVSVMLGNGNGTFQGPIGYGTGTHPFSMAIADVNADGKLDLAIGNFGSGNVSVLLGNGNGTFQGQITYPTGSGPLGTALVDVNGDGKLDVVTGNGYASNITVLLGNGNGTFQAPSAFATGSFPPALTMGDVNGDGILDVVTPNRNSGNVSVLLGNGNGTFQGHMDFAAGNHPQSVAIGDLNGDGKPDLAVANWYSSTVSVLLGNGNGTFQNQTTLGGVSSAFWVEAVDMNNDGNRDLVVANRGSASISVFLGNGNGTFQGAKTLGVGTYPVNVVVADLNGDGRPDLITGNTGSGNVSVLLNAGNGNFTGQVYNIVPFASHFSITTAGTTVAGNPLPFFVTALDPSNNTSTTYNGTVHFTSSDPQNLWMATTATLTNGVGFFAVTLKTGGLQTLSATDVTTSSVTGTSAPILVTAAAANHLVVSVAPLPSYANMSAAYPSIPAVLTTFATAGKPVTFTVTAFDPYGNIDPNYAGTVGFNGTDGQAVLPQSNTLTSGVGTFSATLNTPGVQTLTATDTVSGINGTTGVIPVRGLVVTSFTPTPSGFSVTFNKAFNPGVVSMYTPLPAGSGGMPDDIMLSTFGTQVSVRGSVVYNADDTGFTFVRTATISAVGTFNPTSGLLTAGNYTVTLRSGSIGLNGLQDTLGGALDGTDSAGSGANYCITFSVSPPPVAVGIPDFARGPSNTDAVYLPSTIGNGGSFDLVYANPTPGTATVTFSTTPAILQSNIQAALNALPQVSITGMVPDAIVSVINDVSTGANVQITFQNSLAAATGQLLASDTPGVSIAPATINLANNVPGNGIPIALSNGLNVTSGSFSLEFNPALLSVSGATTTIPGATFTVSTTIHNATSATAFLSFTSPTPLGAGAVTLGSLVATVPLSATARYGARQILHFSSEQLNGIAGPIAVTGQDAVAVAAYFGDVSGEGGPINLDDVNAASLVADVIPSTQALTLPGFSAFANLDPIIIGDVAMQNLGFINSTDASTLNQELITPKVTIPYAPIGLPSTPPPPVAVESRMSIVESQALVVPAKSGSEAEKSVATNLVPAPVYRINSAAEGTNRVRDLALLQATVDLTQRDWLGEPYLGHNPNQGSLLSVSLTGDLADGELSGTGETPDEWGSMRRRRNS
jgi:hypothetical protein